MSPLQSNGQSTASFRATDLEALQAVIGDTASSVGDEYFRTLVRNLADALGARHAFVSKFTPPQRIRTLAFWSNGGIIPNIDGLSVGRIAQRSMRYYSRLILTMRRMPQPVICAVNGPAYGGGMCLTLAAEMRIASETATFNATGIVNGLTSTELAASWLLPRLVGAAHSNDMLLTGRRIDADEAYRMGLVSRVIADSDLREEVLAIAARMCEFSPYGLAMTKDILWVNLENPSLVAAIEIEDRNQLMLGFTENLPEAIRAFDQGRDPVYTDAPRRDLFST